jgi:diaminopimelate epimerase
MKFWKYQGTGNDFVMVDQRQEQWLTRADTARIKQLCDRRFGIGGDGLILLQNMPGYDFEMIYFNSDGNESSMCGNGGRCIASFAKNLGISGEKYFFLAVDGEHEALVSPTATIGLHWVELKMGNVRHVEINGNVFVLNTGSPHYVRFEDQVENLDMVKEGRAIRCAERFNTAGINVNIVCRNPKNDGSLQVRTYERGVEDETLACGTGVTAAAIASTYFDKKNLPGDYRVPVQTKGGELTVRFHADTDGTFSEIWLCGPAAVVFEGIIHF